jgi:ABC-type multidrug transport system ATPase subunit
MVLPGQLSFVRTDSGATMRPMIAVAAAGLCRRYGRRWALTDVSFEIPEGALVMVTGRNGSGKSTLLRVLSTAIRADRGTARMLGHDLHRERDAVRAEVALLGHRTHLYEPLTALENLDLLVDGLLQRLRREGVTVLMATHLLTRGRALCDRGLVQYESQREPIGTPAVRTSLTEDLYVSLHNIDTESKTVGLLLLVNPMVGWIWIATAVTALGGVIALLPSARRRAVVAEAADASTAASLEGAGG